LSLILVSAQSAHELLKS